ITETQDYTDHGWYPSNSISTAMGLQRQTPKSITHLDYLKEPHPTGNQILSPLTQIIQTRQTSRILLNKPLHQPNKDMKQNKSYDAIDKTENTLNITLVDSQYYPHRQDYQTAPHSEHTLQKDSIKMSELKQSDSPQQHYKSGKTPQEMPSELLWNNEKHQAISDNCQDHINHIRKINTDLKRVFRDTPISTTNQSNTNPQEASGTWMLTRSTSNSINSDWTTNPKIQNQNQRNQNPKTAMMKKSISSDNEEPKPKRLSKRYRDLLMQSSQMNNEQHSKEENVSSERTLVQRLPCKEAIY
ncbi:hypothetical protein AGABI1DRAFT_95865, partial [Agaricus bisporus var. burnettii JB137-S8]